MKFIRYLSLIFLIIFCLPMFYSYSQNEDTLSPGEHYAVINGVKLWYLVRGEGPVLLFHPGGAGWGGDASPYIETLKPLEKERTVVYLEPRGIGHSERLSDSTAYSMEEYVEETEALRRYFGLKKITIAGHCYGGFIAMKYAIKFPDNVERLLLLNTTPHVLLGDYDTWQKSREGYDEAISKEKLVDWKKLTPDEMLRTYYRIWIPVHHFRNYANVSINFIGLLNNMIVSSKPTQYFVKHERNTYDIRGDIENITVPTLIVVGDDDLPHMKIGSQLLQERIHKSELVVIENCGHWPFVEAPNEFFKKVFPFLSS